MCVGGCRVERRRKKVSWRRRSKKNVERERERRPISTRSIRLYAPSSASIFTLPTAAEQSTHLVDARRRKGRDRRVVELHLFPEFLNATFFFFFFSQFRRDL